MHEGDWAYFLYPIKILLFTFCKWIIFYFYCELVSGVLKVPMTTKVFQWRQKCSNGNKSVPMATKVPKAPKFPIATKFRWKQMFK
jgi:hypothetical protein